ncbi:MAG: DUF6290 family protein [Coriobacteriia bacterium]|nr:DUF6290 family protein [Coriobacteriia bacterium]
MSTTVVSTRFTDDELSLIKGYASQERRQISDVIKMAVLDKIEGSYWTAIAEDAWIEYANAPVFL